MTISSNNAPDHQPLANPSGLFAERLAALRQLAPELFAGSVDGVPTVAALQAFVGETDNATPREAFEFSWVGKAEAKRGAGMAPQGTLVPEQGTNGADAQSQNLIIEGDNLEVLRILRKSYAGKIKLIYIDPPYNTGNDFVYPDNYAEPVAEYLRRSGAVDGDGRQLTANTRADGRFHAKWLTMMYPRLVLARELLRDDGVIFVSIDDNEVHHLRAIMNEIFGEENFVAQVIWQRAYSPVNLKKTFSENHDYIVCFARDATTVTLYGQARSAEADARYSNPDNDPRGPWKSGDLSVGPAVPANIYEIRTPSGRVCLPPSGRSWLLSQERFAEFVRDNRIWFGADGNNVPSTKRFLSEVKQSVTPLTIWPRDEVGDSQEATRDVKAIFDDRAVFDYPKPVRLIQRILDIATRNDDIVLDFFAGSGTTGHAVLNQNAKDGGNRRFILVQFPESLDPRNSNQQTASEVCDSLGKPRTIAEITKERVRRAAAKIRNEHPMFVGDVGFQSFKLVESHINALPQRTYADGDMQTSTNDMFAQRLKDGWTPDGLASELLLREGFPLTCTYTVVDGWRVYTSDDVGYPLYINLDATIASVAAFLAHLAARGRVGVNKRHGVAICHDNAISAADRINVAEYVTVKTL
jgi:adenine-specific DNA-methyltransferase